MGAEDFLEGLGEKTGDAVEGLGGAAADGLDKVGWESGAEWVRDGSESVAGRLGAEVDERELGETTDPKELLRGSPEAIEARAGHLADFSGAFERVGQGMKGLDAGDWRGAAADRFREKFDVQPKQWLRAADACQDASRALKSYAETVRWAQGQAREAIAKWNKAQTHSEQARDAHNEKVRSYNEAADRHNAAARDGGGGEPGQPPTKPGEFTDPGDEGRVAAKHILAEARHQRDSAAQEARAKVRAATELAPKEPSFGEKLKATGTDVFMGVPMHAAHAGVGVVKGVNDMVRLARTFTPMDSYNISHPSEMMARQSMTLAGLASTAAHPERIPMAALGSGWKDDPAEAGGTLLSNLIGTKGAGGAVRGAARAGMRDGFRAGAKAGGRQMMESVGRAQAVARKMLDSTGNTLAKVREQINKLWCGDPVDVATGHLGLGETDVLLPALLPLGFSRAYDSSYRAGRWFGPAWSSTADQRLEVDAEGVIFVCEDASLLPFPHPAPGVPTRPVTGPRRWELAMNEHGEYTVKDPISGRTWHFDAPPEQDGTARLAQIDDRTGQWLTFEYDDESGAPTAIEHSAGPRLEIETVGQRVTALRVEGEQQPVMRYGYDGNGHLSSLRKDTNERVTEFTNDSEGRILGWRDTNGSTYSYTYDDQDRCIRQSGAEGHLAGAFRYEDLPVAGHATVHTNSLGHATRYEFNRGCLLTKETDATGAVTRYAYDENGRLARVTDPLGRVASYAYDDIGQCTLIVRPDGRYTSLALNEQGRALQMVHPDGLDTSLTWNDAGNCTSTTQADGATTFFSYTSQGHLASVTDALGESTRIECSPTGLPEAVTDPSGRTMTCKRDVFGNVTEVTDASGGRTLLEWTPSGLPLRRVRADGTAESWTYDEEGNCLTHTDAAGGVTRFEYGTFDLRTARIDPDGARYEFGYDTELRLTAVTDPLGQRWSYERDAQGRVVRETDFDGRTVEYGFDPAGQLVRQSVDGREVVYAYDELGRMTAKGVEAELNRYRYGTAGELVRAEGRGIAVVVERDVMGRTLSETVNGRTVRYGYDRLGRRTERVTPGGVTSAWDFDASGATSQVSVAGTTVDFHRDLNGQETGRSYGPTGVTVSSALDELGRLVESNWTAPSGTTVLNRRYRYRQDGVPIRIENSGKVRSYAHDPMGRVTEARSSRLTERYAYDGCGNQTTAEHSGRHPAEESSGPREYAGTRLRVAGRIRYEYDESGRVVLRQRKRLSRKPETWRYEWDAEDRLVSCTTPDGAVWRYAYDPLGRRVAKQRIEGERVAEHVDFVHDGQVLCEQTTRYGPGSGTTLTWEYENGRPLAQAETKPGQDPDDTDSRFFAIVSDLVGAPTELLDEDGAVAWRAHASVWGATAWKADATAYTPLRFPGQYADPETGLHFNNFRHYDPASGRFVSPDPLGLAAGGNPMAYVNSPQVQSDPLGLLPEGCTALGGWYRPIREHWKNQGGEVNHIPAKAAYKHLWSELGWRKGPAIYMDEEDHDQLSSTGPYRHAKVWRAEQRALIDQGRIDLAMLKDVEEVRKKFPNKYDQHISDMIDSLEKNDQFQSLLKNHGWGFDYGLFR